MAGSGDQQPNHILTTHPQIGLGILADKQLCSDLLVTVNINSKIIHHYRSSLFVVSWGVY